MPYNITLPLPKGWEKEQDEYMDESGVMITHLECHLPNDKKETEDALIDIYVGEMPSDTCAADEALANYADTVGFDDSDPEDFDPIIEWPFNGKKAYGFEALCDDDSPMRLMCIEVKKGILLIMVVVAKDDKMLEDVLVMVEHGMRVS